LLLPLSPYTAFLSNVPAGAGLIAAALQIQPKKRKKNAAPALTGSAIAGNNFFALLLIITVNFTIVRTGCCPVAPGTSRLRGAYAQSAMQALLGRAIQQGKKANFS